MRSVEHLEKRPDLSILLSARALRFPLIAEAKIIDSTKGENLYCSQGLRRFLNGEYGWGGCEAFMIAYVRDGSTIAGRLKPYLAQSAQATNYAVQNAPIAISTGGCDAARSRHGRSFLYSHMAPPANDPGPIAVWHLWLEASAFPTAYYSGKLDRRHLHYVRKPEPPQWDEWQPLRSD